MTKTTRYFIILAVIAVPVLLKMSQSIVIGHEDTSYKKISDIWLFTHLPLSEGYSTYFAASGECEICHGFDTAHVASVDLLGNDINVVDDWRSSMMANAARDPFWQAKVSHEVNINPEGKVELESTCTTCHAPMARYNAIFEGQTHYSMDEMLADPLGMDGVSCLACHKQTDERLGKEHSGVLHYSQAYVVYGPYESPLNSPMAQETGYSPFYSPHIKDAGICAGCHTLITGSVDLEGAPTGQTFVEQATYHEWLNSAYKDVQSCQECHMPSIEKGQVFIAAGYETEPRSPFAQHSLVGANAFMLQLLRNNIDSLGLTASEEQFDESINKTYELLQNRSVNLNVELLNRTIDTAFLEVDIKNITGHKFPSGYPSRRAFVKVTAATEEGDVVFESGAWDEDFEVIGQDPYFEPHYDTIRNSDEVQIYEMVVGNVNNERTTVLEQMVTPLKDNRLVPVGFSTTHEVYDTVAIVGKARTDANFNQEEGLEGTGGDKIYYHIPLNGVTEALEVTTQVYYQTTPPRWMEDMFAVNTPEIEKFKALFEAADRTPIKVKEKKILLDLFVKTNEPANQPKWLEVTYLSPLESKMGVYSALETTIDVFNLEGKLMLHKNYQKGAFEIDLQEKKGIYLIRFQSKTGHVYTQKVIF